MNRKSIELKLRTKFEDWLESIEDESVKDLVDSNTIITGGCIASLLLGEGVNDFDLYFSNKETVKAIALYYVKQFNDEHRIENRIGQCTRAFVLDGACDLKEQVREAGYNSVWKSHMLQVSEDRIKIIIRSDGVAGELPDPEEILERGDDLPGDLVEEEGYRPIFLSPNAITLSNKMQLVIRFYGEPDEIHENYDFVHCTNYWTSWSNSKLVTNIEALESLLSKNLVYMGSKYPLCSVIRTRKFLKQGWHINAGQYLKMLFQVSELDLTDIAVLEDQLVGVDTAYFMTLIQALEAQKERDKDFTVDSTYIVSLIDRIF